MDYKQIQQLHPELFRNDFGYLTIITDPEEIHLWQEQTRIQLTESSQPLDWADIGILLQDPFTTFLRDLVEFAPGVRRGYSRLINTADLRGGQAVVAFPLFKGKVILLHQFRHTTRSFHFEVPRGFGEPGIAAKDQVYKEIEEEIHGEIWRMVDLGPYHNNTGMECGEVELFYIELERYGKPSKIEGIKSVYEFDLEIFEGMVRDGKITDGFTIAAYTRAKLNGLI